MKPQVDPEQARKVLRILPKTEVPAVPVPSLSTWRAVGRCRPRRLLLVQERDLAYRREPQRLRFKPGLTSVYRSENDFCESRRKDDAL